MMLDSHSRSLRYHNENGLILDPQAENKDAMLRVQYWSLAEIETFKERYLAHPKNFGYIANALDNKVKRASFSLSSLIVKDAHTVISFTISDVCVSARKTRWDSVKPGFHYPS